MTNYSTYSDTKLLELLKEDDEVAFYTVYKRYWDKLLVIAGKRLNDKEEAEEVLQDVFLNLWRRKNTLELRKGFDNYFAVAVKFEIINRLAKRARETSRNKNLSYQSYTSEDISERFDLKILEKQLEHTISSLPPKCQLVFRLSRESGYTNKKIAEELNISDKAVEKHITQALKILRSRFGSFIPLIILLLQSK